MKRRTFLGTAGTAAAASLPAPAIAQGVRELKLISSYPSDPLQGRIASLITRASSGRLKIRYFGAGELFDSFEVFDAVSEGIADMYFSTELFWHARSRAYHFFATIPYGLTVMEMAAWIATGGGQDLWDELSANYNIKPLIAGGSAVQMGGWYLNEINSPKDFQGLRIRIAGLGADVLTRLGAIAVTLPPGQIVSALESGGLDAAEYAAPYWDLALGLHKTASFYYYPGFHEPGLVNSLGVNLKLWNSLNAEERNLITMAAESSVLHTYVAGEGNNMRDLKVLLKQHGVQMRRFNDEIMRTLGRVSGEVVAEIGDSDPFTRRVYESYIRFRKDSLAWSDVSERAYLNARVLDFPYGN